MSVRFLNFIRRIYQPWVKASSWYDELLWFQDKRVWCLTGPDSPVTSWECECWSPGVIMSDVSVSNPGELWHKESHSIRELENKQRGLRLIVIVTWWRVSAFLTVTSPLHSSSWAHLTWLICLFFPLTRGRIGQGGWYWPLIGQWWHSPASDWSTLASPHLAGTDHWSLPQREASQR